MIPPQMLRIRYCRLICNVVLLVLLKSVTVRGHCGALAFISFFFSVHAFGLGLDPLDSDLPEVPAPGGASWYWVSKNMAYNGLPMSIKMFEFAGTADQVKSFYRNYWRMEGHGQTSEKDFGIYTILSQDLRGYYTTVQFRLENGFIKGKIVVSESRERGGQTRSPNSRCRRGQKLPLKLKAWMMAGAPKP